MELKYVIMENKSSEKFPVLFSKFINHIDVLYAVRSKEVEDNLEAYSIPISAGFVNIADNSCITHGRSDTLDLESSFTDAFIIKEHLGM